MNLSCLSTCKNKETLETILALSSRPDLPILSMENYPAWDVYSISLNSESGNELNHITVPQYDKSLSRIYYGPEIRAQQHASIRRSICKDITVTALICLLRFEWRQGVDRLPEDIIEEAYRDCNVWSIKTGFTGNVVLLEKWKLSCKTSTDCRHLIAGILKVIIRKPQ